MYVRGAVEIRYCMLIVPVALALVTNSLQTASCLAYRKPRAEASKLWNFSVRLSEPKDVRLLCLLPPFVSPQV